MGKVTNGGFFSDQTPNTSAGNKSATTVSSAPEASVQTEKKLATAPVEAVSDINERDMEIPAIRVNPMITQTIKELESALLSLGQNGLAASLKNVLVDALCEKFTVAVVGEFNRGKSTFINELLGKEILPVGGLPTTAMLTKIRYNKEDGMIVFDPQGKAVKALPLKSESWNNYIADVLTGQNPEGTVLVGLKDQWLKNTRLEFFDTPGAGDLNEKRALRIGEALTRCDGAVITINATAALSLSERTFIEQRIITRKMPFMMMVVTHIDQVSINERIRLMDYIKAKLDEWKIDIPVYIPYDVEMPDGRYKDIIGMDKVRKHIMSWLLSPTRRKLTETWIVSRALEIADQALTAFNEQKRLIDLSDEKRLEVIKEKENQLEQVAVAWEEFTTQMTKRCAECYKEFLDKVDSCKEGLIGRLQYEAAHASKPQDWWEKDYPYRVKIELANVAAAADGVVRKKIAEDVRWLNTNMMQQFKSSIIYDASTVVEKPDEPGRTMADCEFQDLDKKRNISRIATVVLAGTGSALLMLIPGGAPVIFATMGISTIGSIVTEKRFKKQIVEQQEYLKDALATEIPIVLAEAIGFSQSRITDIYNDIMKQMEEKKNMWMESQRQAILNSTKPQDTESRKKLQDAINMITRIYQKINIV